MSDKEKTIAGLPYEAFENDAAPEKSAVRNQEVFDQEVAENVERAKKRAAEAAAQETGGGKA